MSAPKLVSAEEMRHALRARCRGIASALSNVLGSELPCGPHSASETLKSFRAKLQSSGDHGIVNLFGHLLLEPRNPFEPRRRRLPRREVVVVGLLVGVLLAAVIWFNVL